MSELLSWPLRHPAYPDRTITLRLLLSHRSSLTDAVGYYAVPLDGRVRDILDDPRLGRRSRTRQLLPLRQRWPRR